MDPNSPQQPFGGSPGFMTTHWSLVMAAGARNNLEADKALEQLCRSYWYPLYAFIRGRGYSHEAAQDLTPEKYFEKQWASTVIEKAMQALREEYEQTGKDELFERLKDHLWGNKTFSYGQIAEAFEMNEGSVKAAAFRLRKRFDAVLRAEISHTVQPPEEIDEELDALIQLFA